MLRSLFIQKVAEIVNRIASCYSYAEFLFGGREEGGESIISVWGEHKI